jgi:hypothetical protein
MVIVEDEAKHGAFEIVHSKTLVPKGNPVIEVVGDNEFVIVPPPETKVQTPVPTVAVLAVITVVGEEIQIVCDAPAFETVGTSLTIKATVEEDGEQGTLPIVHWKIFVPKPNPVIVVFGEVGLEIVPLPKTNVHKPVPTVGVLADIKAFGLVIQSVCVVPALATVGTSLTSMVIVEDEAKQGAFEIVHWKTFVPNAKPVIVVVGNNEFVITPVPETKVQAPTPTDGKLAFITVDGEEIQIVCDAPAFETVGTSLTIKATVEEDGEQGTLPMVHWKIFVPKPNPVIVVFGEVGLVIVPLPKTNVHKPVPTVGVLADIKAFGLVIQSVCVVPALATVGISLTSIVIVEDEAKHGAFEIVHWKTFVPNAKPVIVVVGNNEFVITPVPETKVQAPTPTEGKLAFITVDGEEIQIV